MTMQISSAFKECVVDEQKATEQPANPLAGASERWSDSSTASSKTATRWLRILQRVSEGATSHLDLHSLLRELLGRIRDAMQVDNAAILLVSDDGTHLNLYAARSLEEDVTGKVHVPMGRGIAGTIAATRKPLVVDDLSRVEVENLLLRATAHSLVGVPLLLDDRCIGVIHVDSARPHHFTVEDSQLLQVIASRVSLAIDYALLYESERAARHEAELATRQLQALQAVSDVAMEHAQLSDLLHALLIRIQQMMEVDNVAILLPTPDMKELTLYSVRGPEEAVMGKVHVPMGEGVAGTIAASRRPLLVENLASVPVANSFLREHFRSLLGVPLLVGDRLVGVIHVDTTYPREFTVEETQLLQTLAERIARAIDRAREYESVEQSRAEAEHRVAVLEEATERMDEFLGIAGHELRTPLTSLHMNVQMLDYWLIGEQGRREGEPEVEYTLRASNAVRPLIRRSGQSIRRLDRLIGDLLDASRIRENRLELRLACIDLARIASEVVEEYGQAHPQRTLVLDVQPGTDFTVMADTDRIAQVISNFVSNALKYSRSDQMVAVALRGEGGRARIAVRDEGVGIPAGEHEQIWERFYRASGIGHQSGSQVGMGLGLYISRDIVERHGGTIGIESVAGQGSTFWFALPLASAQAAGEP
jgi:signal transduction histidine kinase